MHVLMVKLQVVHEHFIVKNAFPNDFQLSIP